MAAPNVTEVPSGLGSAITPQEWSRFVLDHLYLASVVLVSGATRIETGFKQIHVPKVVADGAASWYNELEQIAADGPLGDELILTPRKVAALVNLSNEVIVDSAPAVLDVVGTSLVRAVALEADRAILNGAGGKQPNGVLGQAAGTVDGPPSIDSLITAVGLVAGVGGNATALYINPSDLTVLMLSKDNNGRPLLEADYATGPAGTLYGLHPYSTPAMPAGTALVADAREIVVAVREDPTVAVSSDVLFTSDGSVCRVLARLDAGVNDPRGLVKISGGGSGGGGTSKK